MQPALIKASELGGQIGVSPFTVMRWAKKGIIPSYRFSYKTVRFNLDEVVRSLKAAGREVGQG